MQGATLTVSGNGRVDFEPDTCFITATAEGQDDWSGSAIARVNKRIEDLKLTLERHSIMPDRFKESILNLSSTNGITASKSLTIRMSNLDDIGPLYTLLSSIDGIKLSEPLPAMERPEEFVEKAIEKATSSAIKKGEEIAKAMGTAIDAIKEISVTKETVTATYAEITLSVTFTVKQR